MGRLQTDVGSKDSSVVRGYPDVIHTLFILCTDGIHTVRGVAPHHAWLRRLVSGYWPVVLQFIVVACRLSALNTGRKSTSERLLTNNRILFSHHEN